jgi:hypothetical protein
MEAEDLADGLARLRLSTQEAGDTKRKAHTRRSRKDAKKSENLYKFSQEDERRLAAAFGKGSSEEILLTKFNIPIHRYLLYLFIFNNNIVLIRFRNRLPGGTYDCCSPRSGSTTRSSTTT